MRDSNAPDTFREGDKVRIKYDDPNIAPESREGEISAILSNGFASVTVDGRDRMYSFDQLERIPLPEVACESLPTFSLLRTLTSRATQQLSEEDGSDPFQAEIRQVFAKKVVGITNELIALRRKWDETISQKLGSTLTTFIEMMCPHLDQLITLVGVAEDDAKLRHARSKFEELLELSAEVTDDPHVRAWAEMQDEELKGIFK